MTEPRPPRDSQRARVYRAETPLPGRRLATLEECAAYADSVVGTLWWQVRFPQLDLGRIPRLRPGHGARHAYFRTDTDGPTITLPRRYRTAGVMLHELAHWALDEQRDLPHHGRTFARLLLDATEEFAGERRAAQLLEAFGAHRVHVAGPARLGPDRLWHYGWDERLRLSQNKRLSVLHGHDGDPAACTTGVFEGFEQRGSSIRVRERRRRVRIPVAAIWEVRPVRRRSEGSR